MSSVWAVLLLVGGLLLVVIGADLLLDGVLAVAARLGGAPFAVTVVVSGFELENLAAGIAANAKGLPGAAAGTFLGGTTFLALGVAGLGGLVAPMRSALPRRGLVWTAVAPLPLVALAVDGRLTRIDGAALVCWFAVALIGLARSAPVAVAAEIPRRRGALLRLAAGLAALAIGGELLGDGLRRVVGRFGVSETLLGNTAVAASVEGEEVARVGVSARRGRSDVALGNVLGTIVHFAAFNAGVIALVKPLRLDGPSLHLHLPTAAAAAVLVCLLIGVRGGLGRLEGLALTALYAAYIALAVSGSIS